MLLCLIVVVLNFHIFFKGLDTPRIRINEVSKNIDIGYGYVNQIEVQCFIGCLLFKSYEIIMAKGKLMKSFGEASEHKMLVRI
ncbi:hypothetical protein AAZX31_06G241800 [Glycine max]|uniref:Uncharacterized protein n=2 Tax=Glycine subgen. Soja TaxID=1462606 RepID=K7KXF9_SOYBN|nr:hypothetical protein GYH30_016310 [Glycine max]KRH55501.1 hypothetical protein GLYMA_06G259500v4 [Glycine max]RZC09235.1 hypothetical protein D0Y65_015828 [Glycine soja]